MALTVYHKDGEAYLGEKPLKTLAKNKSFSELIFIVLSEREPTDSELSVFELILNLSTDHGPDTPSAKTLIEKAKSGEDISEAIASGIKEIGDFHGGAQEKLMPILYKIVKENLSVEEIVSDYKKKEKRLPGFGHRFYKESDPRAELIISRLQDKELGAPYISAARTLEKALVEIIGKRLPLNIDGAIAVALCAFNFSPALGRPVFIIARSVGLSAHALEEYRRGGKLD
jgi:citrate synthase